MIFEFKVTVEAERESGKFISKDEAREQCREAIEQADPQTVEGGADGDSIYNIIQWEVEDS